MARRTDRIRILTAPTDDDPEYSPDIPDRNFAKSILEVGAALVEELGDAWDQPPRFGTLTLDERVDLGGAEALRLSFVPLSNYTLMARGAERAWHPVVDLAEGVRLALETLGPKMIAPANLMAVALINEGWAIFSDDEADAEEVHRIALRRGIDSHPRRVEVRLVHIVDRDGVRYMFQQRRDTGATAHMMGTGRRDAFGRRHGPLGDVSNSLKYFLEVSQGLDPPTWNEWRRQDANLYHGALGE